MKEEGNEIEDLIFNIEDLILEVAVKAIFNIKYYLLHFKRVRKCGERSLSYFLFIIIYFLFSSKIPPAEAGQE